MKLKLIGITAIAALFINCSSEPEEINVLDSQNEFNLEKVNDITKFGAIANNNSTLPIVEAIRTAQNNQYPVYIPRGVYYVTETINIPSDVMIIGSGRESILKQANNEQYNPKIVLNLHNTTNITLRDFTIEGAYNLDPSIRNVGLPNIQLFECNHIEMQNLYIHRSFGDGIAIYNSENSKVTNCLITMNGASGMKFQESNHLDIINNRISYNQAYGIALQNNSTDITQYNGIENRYVSIKGNTVSHNDLTGIWLPAFHSYVNNKLISNITSPIGKHFIISNNQVFLNKNNGIGCQVSNSVISGNICSKNGNKESTDPKPHAFQGILVNADGVSVTNNSVTESTGVGIDLGGCINTTCTSNTVSENGFIGIEINACNTTVVANNILANNNTVLVTNQGHKSCGILVHNGSDTHGTKFEDFTGGVKNIVISGNNLNQQSPYQTYGIRVEDIGVIENVTVTDNILPFTGSVYDIAISGSGHTEESNIYNTKF